MPFACGSLQLRRGEEKKGMEGWMQLSWEGVVGSNSKGCGKWMENGRLFFHGFSALRESPSVWNFGTS